MKKFIVEVLECVVFGALVYGMVFLFAYLSM